MEQSFGREEIAIPIKCNIHAWMKAYAVVLASPYFAVTGSDGAFELRNVPPGTYTVTAWHETLGNVEQNVVVAPKESKTVTLTLKANPAAR